MDALDRLRVIAEAAKRGGTMVHPRTILDVLDGRRV